MSEMGQEHKESIRKAAFRRNYCCGGCNAIGLIVLDGSQIGGMPGINYKYCRGCGWSRPIVKRRRRPAGWDHD